MKLLHVCLCVCALLSSAESFLKKIMYRSPCGMQLVTSDAIDIYFEFPVSLTAWSILIWNLKKAKKKFDMKKQKIKTSNIFVLIKLGKVPLSSQKQNYHSFTYLYPVKTGKNPVVDTHLCKYGRCNHKVTKNPWLKFVWASFTSWKNKLLKCCGLFGK